MNASGSGMRSRNMTRGPQQPRDGVGQDKEADQRVPQHQALGAS